MKQFTRQQLKEFDFVVVGAGFYGLTLAHQLAQNSTRRILVVDSRMHLGGNAFSYTDTETNIEIHKYGSHLFHTSNDRVWNFVNQFGEFNNYRHKVKTQFENQVYSMPINLHTINQFMKTNFSPSEAKDWVESCRIENQNPINFEEQAIALIGEPLYKAFIAGYTAKQWQTDPKDLPAEIIRRLPVNYSYNDNYFNDTYEGLPLEGYGKIFQRMCDLPNIRIELGITFDPNQYSLNDFNNLIYTGPIDRFFSYSHGQLGWRTLDFEMEVMPVGDFQGTSVMNYADLKVPYTRIHEFKHLHPERDVSPDSTIIVREFSRFADIGDDPYYPINAISDREKLVNYRIEAEKLKNVVFGGRLGRYQYLDMHMAIASALKTTDEILSKC